MGFYAGGPCRFHLDDVTIKYGRRTMHLIFDLDVTWTEIGSYTIDSLPFQDGTFALGRPQIADSREVSHAQRVMFVPAEMWKRVDPYRVGR